VSRTDPPPRPGHAQGAPAEHRAYAPAALACFVLTVSDSRSLADDTAGALIAACLAEAGHSVAERRLVPDETDEIRAAVAGAIERADVDAVLVTGGTGVSPRDCTPEAVAALLDKRLDGFGELFRALSYQEIGAAAMLSRALAGSAGRKAVFVMPGSRAAVELAMKRLVLPELGHLVGQLRR
jgi:molybdenum cofactor biosynthesis protein B